MLFNSLQFLIYFPAVVLVYFWCPKQWRWAWLLLASAYFYMAFVPKYILILIFLIVVDFYMGRLIERSSGSRRRLYLYISLLANIGTLFLFKYFNFFNDNAASLAHFLHWNYSLGALRLLLPIGLSFHTFQSLAYVIEVYKGRYPAENHMGYYALYVMYFPQLVAGPIERPAHLLPQLKKMPDFAQNDMVVGLRLMLWGFFKKVVVADRLALMVGATFNALPLATGPQLLLAAFAFSWQIYGDFSGYSDIAIGAAKTMGINLTTNFKQPYFSQSIGEFWRRWHISLSSWFRDYVYIPLGGSRVAKSRWFWNIMITFLLSGFWHGANWTFLAWGALHGIYLAMGEATKTARERIARRLGFDRLPKMLTVWRIIMTFLLVMVGWIFFRAASLKDAWYVLSHLFSGWRPALSLSYWYHSGFSKTAAVGIVLIAAAEWFMWRGFELETFFVRRPRWQRWSLYYALVLTVLFLGYFANQTFIYFQF